MRHMNFLGIMIALAAFFVVSDGHARERKALMDAGWRFVQQEGDARFCDPEWDDSQWRVVDLPHDWSIEGVPAVDEPSGNDGGYRPTGKGWYRREMNMTAEDMKKLHSLYFEGVYMDAEVFVNGHSLR